MYCKKCGDELLESDSNYKNGEHYNCRRVLRHCNYCGEKETNDTVFLGVGAYVYCQPNEKKCYYHHQDEINDNYYKDMVKKYPVLETIDESIKDIVLDFLENEEDDCYDEKNKEFLKLLDSDGYIIMFSDSDGNISYEDTPDNREIFEYVVKSKHRTQLGFNCNLYVDNAIYRGKKIDCENLL